MYCVTFLFYMYCTVTSTFYLVFIYFWLLYFQRFYRTSKWQFKDCNETMFNNLVAFSQRDEDVRHLLETVFLISESEDYAERSCLDLGANRLAVDRALHTRLNRSDPTLTQNASILLPLFDYYLSASSEDAARDLQRAIEGEMSVDEVSFGTDPATVLRAQFTCLAVNFNQFDPFSHRVKYTIRKEFDEVLQPSDRSWFIDLEGEHF